jgi:hypothetical protein
VSNARATCCLRFIDQYGDTTFNQLQLPVLIDEFATLRSATQDPQLRQRLDDDLEHLERFRLPAR